MTDSSVYNTEKMTHFTQRSLCVCFLIDTGTEVRDRSWGSGQHWGSAAFLHGTLSGRDHHPRT